MYSNLKTLGAISENTRSYDLHKSQKPFKKVAPKIHYSEYSKYPVYISKNTVSKNRNRKISKSHNTGYKILSVHGDKKIRSTRIFIENLIII